MGQAILIDLYSVYSQGFRGVARLLSFSGGMKKQENKVTALLGTPLLLGQAQLQIARTSSHQSTVSAAQ